MSRKMKWLSLVVAVVMLLPMFTIAPLAADSSNFAIKVQEGSFAKGETFTVIVSNTAMNLSALTFGVQFDKDVLECISVVSNIPGAPAGKFYLKKDDMFVPMQELVVSLPEEANITGAVGFGTAGTGTSVPYFALEIATITFKVKDDAASETVLSLFENSEGTDAVNATGLQNVTVSVKPSEVAVSSISISETLALAVGGSSTLTATVLPDNATNQKVTWASDNTVVAAVDADGKVTAKAAGTANITATSADGKVTSNACVVTVAAVKVTEITLDKTVLELVLGGEEAQKTATLSVKEIKPENATNKTVTWSSDNTDVATVDADGVVTAKKAGTANITATAADGSNVTSNACAVTVKQLVTGVTLDKDTLSLEVDGTETLVATVEPDDTTDDKTVTWKSDKETVATVDENGKVTAVGVGTAIITATAGGKSATCEVSVVAKKVPVTGVTLDKDTLELFVGEESDKLVAAVAPSDATNQKVTWESDKPDVATVKDGVVTAVGVGTATITVTTEDGNFKDTCKVTVNPVKVTGVTLDESKLSLVLGGTEEQKTAKLTAAVKPTNATNTNVIWTSSDETVAAVENGKVTAKKAGTATITVKAADDETITATCTVTVTQLVTSVTVSSEAGTSVEKTKTLQLNATVLPDDAENKAVTWSSSNGAIATVDETGKVTAKDLGKVIITATAKDNSGKSASIEIEVVPQVIPATAIEVVPETLALKKGENAALTATVTPADSTDKVEWISSDPAVASVDATGKVTAVGKGTATITAKAGTFTDSCEVTVTVPVTGVKLDKSTASVDEGATVTLTATVEPADADNKNVTWSSDNTAIATVDQNGKVTGVKGGKATITVTTEDGSFKATCEVSVACKHTTSQNKVDSKYLKSAADCQKYAVYFKSCVDCGNALEGTFEDIAGGFGKHNYAKESGVVKEAAVDCQHVTTYWYACTAAGCTANAKDDANAQDKFYNKNEIGNHVFDLDHWGYKAADGHAHACKFGCAAHDAVQAHVPGPEATEEAAQLCTVCNYEIAPMLEPSIDENMLMLLLMMMSKKYDVTAEATEGGMISAPGVTKVKFNKNVTFKITPAEGYVISAVLVDGKDVGAVSEYTFKSVRKDHSIKAVFEKTPWVNPYTDVKESDWFYEAVKFVSETELMNGNNTAGTLFDPTAVCSRSMLVTILWRLEGCPTVTGGTKFSDVKADAWYAAAVNWASSKGIVEGNGNNKYSPDDALTLEQAAVILYRYAAYKGVIEGTATAKSTKLVCSDWAKDAVIWAEANGLLKDIGTEVKDMTKSIHRAEIASMLKSFCEGILVK